MKDGVPMNQQLTETEQAARLKRARRTAYAVAAIAVAVFLFSILQMLWISK
jgi:hypothetical protein